MWNSIQNESRKRSLLRSYQPQSPELQSFPINIYPRSHIPFIWHRSVYCQPSSLSGARRAPTKLPTARGTFLHSHRSRRDEEAASYKQSTTGQHYMRPVRDVLPPSPRNAKHSLVFFLSACLDHAVPLRMSLRQQQQQRSCHSTSPKRAGGASSLKFEGTKHKADRTSMGRCWLRSRRQSYRAETSAGKRESTAGNSTALFGGRGVPFFFFG